MDKETLILIVLALALAVHYIGQKQLLALGWKVDDPKPQIRRLMINGTILIVFAIFALVAARPPYGLFGILLFIEGAVCFAFARKLSRK
ncbi:MAG TPA: hypothetical protein VLL07_05640 [Pontiella sp.]|nr:hypothetical protein [Pontiella sp.]